MQWVLCRYWCERPRVNCRKMLLQAQTRLRLVPAVRQLQHLSSLAERSLRLRDPGWEPAWETCVLLSSISIIFSKKLDGIGDVSRIHMFIYVLLCGYMKALNSHRRHTKHKNEFGCGYAALVRRCNLEMSGIHAPRHSPITPTGPTRQSTRGSSFNAAMGKGNRSRYRSRWKVWMGTIHFGWSLSAMRFRVGRSA